MRRRICQYIAAALLLLSGAVQTSAQTQTQVSVTVTDPNGWPYAGAQLVFHLISPGGPSPTITPCTGPAAQSGCSLQNPSPIPLDRATGKTPVGGVSIWPNANILPAGTTYTISANFPGRDPPVGTGPQICSVSGITIAGGAQDLSAQFSGPACPIIINIVGGGAGSGCTPAGGDTAVQTEHPAVPPTCYGSQDFTWDDGGTAHNLKAGDGTNTFAADSVADKGVLFAYGTGNALFGFNERANGQSNTLGEATSPITNLFVDGENNGLCNAGTEGATGCTDLYVQGFQNTPVSGSDIWIYGKLNSTTNVAASPSPGFVHFFGDGNSAAFSGTGAATFLTTVHAVGAGNTFTARAYQPKLNNAVLVGDSNTITVDGTGGAGAQVTQGNDLYTFGLSNQFSVGAPSRVDESFHFGENITTSNTGGGLTFSTIVANSGNASQMNSTAGSGLNNSGIYGSGNTVTTNTAVTAFTRNFAFGANLSHTNCNHCFLYGENGSNTLSNFLGMGLSTTPEIEITPNVTQIRGLGTQTNCSSSASPAVCAAAPAGSVAIAAAATTETVNTTAVTANSQILLTRDDSLGTKLGVTCNTATVMGEMKVSSRTPGTSFTITVQTAPAANPGCVSYSLIN